MGRHDPTKCSGCVLQLQKYCIEAYRILLAGHYQQHVIVSKGKGNSLMADFDQQVMVIMIVCRKYLMWCSCSCDK